MSANDAWRWRATSSAAIAYGSPGSPRDQRTTLRGRSPMKLQRPTRWLCSADSRRNAGYCGLCPRSFRNAETGVSQSSMKRLRSAITLCSRASSRTSSSDGSTPSEADSTAAAIEHLLGVGKRAVAPAQQDRQVVQDVCGLVVHPLVGLLARGARVLLGLLGDLLAGQLRVVEQPHGAGALRALRLPI